MLVTPVDAEKNLFRVEHVGSVDLAAQVLATDWTALTWIHQEGQENWARKRIVDTAIPWIDQWHTELIQQWPRIEQDIGRKLHLFTGTRIPQPCVIKHLCSPTLAIS